jgi:hydrogenase 3 maturation protease
MKAVISIGNPIKTDDNIGNIVLDKIDVDAMKIRAETSPENFIKKMKGCDEIIIIDALQFGGRVGEVRKFDLENVEDRMMSTHSIPIAMFKKFFPDSKITVVGIQPKGIDFGDEMSDEIKAKTDSIVKEVEGIIRSL